MRPLVALLVTVLASAACGSPTGPDSQGGLDYNQLLQGLRSSGLAAQPAGQLSQPFISIPARLIAIDAEHVQVFEYPDEPSARADAAQISADGGRVWNSLILWVAPPHFYRQGRVLALYVGDRPDIKATLARLLGPQFAGR